MSQETEDGLQDCIMTSEGGIVMAAAGTPLINKLRSNKSGLS